MELHELPFVKIIKLSNDIAEVIVNEGVEYTLEMVDQYHNWIADNMSDPCYILVNRLNSYSYTFEVQQKLGTLDQIRAIAFVTYTRTGKMAVEAMSRMPKTSHWNGRIFDNREDALQWLETLRDA